MASRNYNNTAQPLDLSSGVSASTGATVLIVPSTAGYPAPPFTLALDRGTPSLEEVCLCTSLTATQFTVTRAYDGTQARAHGPGASVEHAVAEIDYAEANYHINNQSHDHHSQYVRKDTLTSVGDLYVRDTNGALVRLPVGPGGQVLTANPALDLGLQWISPTVADNAITTAKIADGAVTPAKFETGTLPTRYSTFAGRTAPDVPGQLHASTDTGALEMYYGASWSQIETAAPWTYYVPSWTNGGNIGNGVLTGYYKQMGKTLLLRVHLIGGTTTTFGSTSLPWYFTLPGTFRAASNPASHSEIGTALLQNNRVTWYLGICYAMAGDNRVSIIPTAGVSVTNATHPWTWGPNDTLDLKMTIEVN